MQIINSKMVLIMGNDNFYTISGMLDRWVADDINYLVSSGVLSKDETLKVLINSPGGNAAAGIQLMEMLSLYWGDNIEAYAIGSVHSAATFPFLAAPKEKRYTSKGATFLLHEPSLDGVGGKSSDLLKISDELGKISAGMSSIYSVKLGLSEDEVSAIMNKDELMKAAEAIKIGLAGGYIEDSSNSESVNAMAEIVSEAMASSVKKINSKGKIGMGSGETPANTGKKYAITSETPADKVAGADEAVMKELDRVRALSSMLGKGYDNKVIEEMHKENGATAEALALSIFMSKQGPEDSPTAEPKAASIWERPEPQAKSGAYEKKPVDEAQAQFDSDPKIRCAFGSVENFKLYLSKVKGI